MKNRKAVRVTATTCRNCACPESGHVKPDGLPERPCLKHEECEDYAPLGQVNADAINAVGFKLVGEDSAR